MSKFIMFKGWLDNSTFKPDKNIEEKCIKTT